MTGVCQISLVKFFSSQSIVLVVQNQLETWGFKFLKIWLRICWIDFLNKFKHLNRYSYDRLISTSCVNNPEVSQYFEFDAYSTFLKEENKSKIIRRVIISLHIQKLQNKEFIFFLSVAQFLNPLNWRIWWWKSLWAEI